MKRVLLVVGAAVLFLSTMVTPSLATVIDGGNNGTTGCGNTLCKP